MYLDKGKVYTNKMNTDILLQVTIAPLTKELLILPRYINVTQCLI